MGQDKLFIGVLLLLLCCFVSSGGLMLLTMGGEGTTGPTGPTGPGPSGPGPSGPGPSGSYPGYITGRYVRLALPVATHSKYVLALHDIRVYDENGVNIATADRVASVSASGSNNGSPDDAIDGERYSTFWISDHSDNLRYFEIDLGSTKKITKIEMYDATGGGIYNGVVANQRMRLGEAYIEIKNTSGARVVKSTPVPYDGGRYYLSFEDSSTPTWTN